MDKNKKLIISILVIVVVVIILGCLIKVAVTGTLFDNTSNNNQTAKTENSSIQTVENVEIKEKTSDSVDYNSYTAKIDLSSLTSSGSGVSISETTVTVTSAGTFYFSGTAQEANIVVNAGDDDKVSLIFDNANITSSKTAVVNGINAKKITINLKDGSANSFTDGLSYSVFTEDDEPNATVFSKTDLDINGTGTLTIKANYEDAIASKDDLVIENATLIVNANDDGIRGKDSLTINNANITVNSKGDAIKSTNEEDLNKGYISINGGTFNLTTESDAIDAITVLKITDGKFTINSKDDGIHSDGYIQIDGGTFDITAVEGIEATYVKINGGTINISASDDGINATNKSDNYSVVIEINGGNITINMGSGDTDGVDSNGDIIINGGTISVTGQSTFDYDGTGTINGGTVICNGSEITTLPNQFMGGGAGGGMAPGGMQGGQMPPDGQQMQQPQNQNGQRRNR